MAFILSSALYIFDASGRSRLRWMASNSHLVVHRPQPMHWFSSTSVAPQPRQREASLRICSSVKVRRSLEKVLAFAASWPGP